MTLRYVRSGAAGAGTGADWANAYVTLAAALTASAAGDTIYVSDDHAETSASAIALTSPGTVTAPVKVICVDHAGSVPPVSADIRTTATVTTTGSAAISFRTANSITDYEGIIFSSGTTGTGTFDLSVNGGITLKFRNCALRMGSAGGGLMTTPSGGRVELENTTLQFNSTGQYIYVQGEVIWRGGSITGSTFPTTLFNPANNSTGYLEVEGVDLSAIAGTIIGSNSSQALIARLMDCKINASATVAATPNRRGFIDYLRLDSGGTNYKHGRVAFAGAQTEETTIVLTGGASDGTTAISWKIITTANSTELFPFESQPIAIWNDTVGSPVTATIQGIWGGGAVPNNDDIWVDVEYLGASGSPLGSFVSNGKATILASNAALSAGAGTWGGSTTKFALAVTFTPQQKGYIFARVKAAKASSTFYIDPKIVLS
ncbi:hypothetical protein [Mesorhizobium sp. RIZ17]|uniref:hypothetical protein n=1 Tax=Mesorhizobium sp. RIZ17 TaxID=3132743 RepID=UPI003DA8FECF